MAAHLNAFREMAKQIENLSSDEGTSRIHGVDLVSMLRVSLPDLYEPLIMALQSRSETLTVDFIAKHLLRESTRWQASTATYENLVKMNPTSQSTFIARGYGRTRERGGGFRAGSCQRGTRGRGCASFGTTDMSRLGNAASANCGQTKRSSGGVTTVTVRVTGRLNALREKLTKWGVVLAEQKKSNRICSNNQTTGLR